jgi:hypothetical protein
LLSSTSFDVLGIRKSPWKRRSLSQVLLYIWTLSLPRVLCSEFLGRSPDQAWRRVMLFCGILWNLTARCR